MSTYCIEFGCYVKDGACVACGQEYPERCEPFVPSPLSDHGRCASCGTAEHAHGSRPGEEPQP